MKTREEWLLAGAKELSKDIRAAGATVPPVRVSVGFPRGSHGGGGKAIGQCWGPVLVEDGKPAIFISPEIGDAARVLDILLHELVHAAVGTQAGHRGEFRRVAVACGLEGKMTATVASPELHKKLKRLARSLGKYRHSKVDDRKRTRQGTRMLKVECAYCGYTVRTTRRWLDVGNPICPEGDEMTEVV